MRRDLRFEAVYPHPIVRDVVDQMVQGGDVSALAVGCGDRR
jgi:hypothetical protein